MTPAEKHALRASDDAVDALARAMCTASGNDPDMIVSLGEPLRVALPGGMGWSLRGLWSHPAWMAYRDLAKVALAHAAVRVVDQEDGSR